MDDLAAACLAIMQVENPDDWYNIGYGEDVSIFELASLIAETVGFKGRIVTDPSKPDGTPRKLMDVSRLKSIGWEPKIDLKKGLKITYEDFKNSLESDTYRSV